jgi:hypothetical protein
MYESFFDYLAHACSFKAWFWTSICLLVYHVITNFIYLAFIKAGDEDAVFGSLFMTVVSFVIGLIALGICKGNYAALFFVMTICNAIGHIIVGCKIDKGNPFASGFVYLVSWGIMIIMLYSINTNWFPMDGKKSAPPNQIEQTKNNSKPSDELREIVNKKLPTIIKKLKSDESELAGKIEKSINSEKQILLKEMEELKVTLNKAENYYNSSFVLLSKYDSTKRTADRNKELGIIVGGVSNVDKVEEEIKTFLKETETVKLKY